MAKGITWDPGGGPTPYEYLICYWFSPGDNTWQYGNLNVHASGIIGIDELDDLRSKIAEEVRLDTGHTDQTIIILNIMLLRSPR